MSDLTNTIQNNALAVFNDLAPRGIVKTIKQASARTGVDFAYLVKQAKAESSFNPTAKAKTSSATGLYQFIEKTWLSMVEKHGEKHGIKTDGKTRGEILELRNDPRAASLMAAEFAQENKQFLQTHWGGEVRATELYFAHFLGAGSAASFLQARDQDPTQQAALLFPKAAQANRNVFYEPSTGRARTLDEVYSYFDGKFTDDVHPTLAHSTQKREANTSPPALDYVKYNSYKAPSYSALGAYQNLFSNPLEIMMLTQMDLPISRKENEFTLFSAYSFLK